MKILFVVAIKKFIFAIFLCVATSLAAQQDVDSIKPFVTWEDILRDPVFQNLHPETKKSVKRFFFAEDIVPYIGINKYSIAMFALFLDTPTEAPHVHREPSKVYTVHEMKNAPKWIDIEKKAKLLPLEMYALEMVNYYDTWIAPRFGEQGFSTVMRQ
jgi:hypothetical protein